MFKEKKPSEEYRKQIWHSKEYWGGWPFGSFWYTTKVMKGNYHLLAGEHESIIPGEYTNDMLEKPSTLKSLLEYSTEIEQVIKNVSGNKMIVKKEDGTVDIDNTGWNKATWYPAIHDFKTRKFKCIGEETVYSEKTGRIIKMVFEEIKK